MGQASFSVRSVPVNAGETVRFVLRNTSAEPRDFTVGSPEVQRIRRGFLMRMISSDIQAIGPAERRKLESWNAVLVLPGETRELVWTFDKIENVEFGSNIAGQYEAGMKGRFLDVAVAESEPEPSPVREGHEGSKTVHPSVQHHVRLSAIRQRVQSVRQRRKTSNANRRPSNAEKPVSKPQRRRIVVRTNFNGGTNGEAYVEERTVGTVDRGARRVGRSAAVRTLGDAHGNGGEPNSSGSSGAGLGSSGSCSAGAAGVGVSGVGGAAGLSGGSGKGGAGGPGIGIGGGLGGAGGPGIGVGGGLGGAGGPGIGVGLGGAGGPGKGGAGGPGIGGGGLGGEGGRG